MKRIHCRKRGLGLHLSQPANGASVDELGPRSSPIICPWAPASQALACRLNRQLQSAWEEMGPGQGAQSVRAGMGVCFLFLRQNNPRRLTRISQSSFTPILPFPGECSENLILCGKLIRIYFWERGGGSCPQNSYLSLKTQGSVPRLPAGCGRSQYEAHTLFNKQPCLVKLGNV